MNNLINLLISILPTSRLYSLKRLLLKIIGVNTECNVRIYSSVKFWGTVKVDIKGNTFIGHEVLITGGESRIVIGKNVDIAPRVLITTGTHKIDMRQGFNSAGEGVSRDITIEDGVWIGANSTILSGVTIGEKTIVAAGSVVNKSVPSYCLVAGVPAKVIKKFEKGKIYG